MFTSVATDTDRDNLNRLMRGQSRGKKKVVMVEVAEVEGIFCLATCVSPLLPNNEAPCEQEV